MDQCNCVDPKPGDALCSCAMRAAGINSAGALWDALEQTVSELASRLSPSIVAKRLADIAREIGSHQSAH